jgi:hypothetical protein
MRNTLLLILAWASITIILVSLPYTSAAMTISRRSEADNTNELQQNEGVIRRGTNSNHHQQQGRQMQEVMEGEEAVATAQEAPMMDIPLPTTTTLAAAVDVSTTESSSPEEPQQQQQQSSSSSINTNNIQYSPIYNTRMKPCKGYETTGLKGYLTLDDLRYDLQLYFYDMNGYSYHRSEADILAALPTDRPSPSPSSSYPPSMSGSTAPSSIPTVPPATPPPTEFPTSSVRIPKEPTKSPSPTMLPKFAGMSSSSLLNNTTSSSENNLVVNIPEGALGGTGGTGDASSSTTAQVVFLSGDQHPADVLGGGDTTDEVEEDSGEPIPIPSLRTGTPTKSPTLKPVEPDENQLILDQGSGRKRMRGGVVGGNSSSSSNTNEVGSGGRRWRRRLQEVAEDAIMTPATIPMTTMTATVASEEEFVEVMNENGQAEVDEIVTNPDNGGEVLIPVALSSEGSNVAESSVVTDTKPQQQQEGGVHFHICPNTNFQFNNLYVAQLSYLPLVIESPVQQPVILACLEENTCTFTAGDYHIVFNNNGLEEDNLDQSSMDQQHSAITISGITFQQAKESSIVMNDPRGKLIFDRCTWQNNEGEAIVIDGKYSSTNLEVEYYGVDDYMLPPGKENPLASTEPTIHAETTEIPMDFLFGSTMAAMTTELNMVAITTGMSEMDGEEGTDDAVGGDGFRLLQETSAVGGETGSSVGGEPKSLILIRHSTFTVSMLTCSSSSRVFAIVR